MSIASRCQFGCAIVALFCGLDFAAAAESAAPAKPKITISKETTYITKPLRPDGYPDYVAALNQRMSEGVTPENNAAVLLAKAYGPKILTESIRAKTYRLLQMAALSEKGDYLVSRTEMLRRWENNRPAEAKRVSDEELLDQFDAATHQPWSREEFPIVAAWISANEIPLRLAVEATQQPKYYWPYVLAGDDPSQTLLAVMLPHAQEARELAVVLAARAMNRTAEKDIAGAWQDIMACYRLARKVAEGFCLVEALVGCAIDSIATSAEVSFAHYGKLSAAQATQFQTELAALPHVCHMADKIDVGERLMFLDITSQLAREGNVSIFDVAESINSLSGAKRTEKKKTEKSPMFDPSGIDWNIPMEMGNEWYDRLTKIARIEGVRKRREACKTFDEDIRKLGNEFKDRRKLLIEFFGSTSMKEFVSPRIGTILVALLIPAVPAAIAAEERTDLNREMAMVALALTAYRADNGGYPEKLDSLVPKYLEKVPDDTFKHKPGPIGYRREGEGYLLWTVHINGLDENGASYDDDAPGDDWVLRPVLIEKM